MTQHALTTSENSALRDWVHDIARLTKPENIVWCDGSEDERLQLEADAVAAGILLPLNGDKRPGSYLHRSNPNDVARVEQFTFICTPTKADAGPTNNWMAPDDAYQKLTTMFDGSMRGRTMYVVPYLMGPPGSPLAKIGVEITDSVYVVLNMRIMTRMGRVALEALGASDDFNRGLHALLDCHPERRFICHFPQDNTIWSVGSGYGGNVLLGKKCLALRIGSWLGRKEGWLAEHMLLLEVESPEGERDFVAGAFPSACGKTNFAMLVPPKHFGTWRVSTLGDDIAWMRPSDQGRLTAVNPEAGYFGVAPGTSMESNPNAMRSVSRQTIFTNTALTPDGDVWWEGMDSEPPEGTVDWQGQPWQRDSGTKAAHPNSRFTAPMTNNPALSRFATDPEGVPISAIIFGGRRPTTVPLVLEAFDWAHGVYLGATMGSETTAAAAGQVGIVRRDPMAMLPFCGYDIGSYFAHWLSIRNRLAHPPRVFLVNWFRKDQEGRFLWPGYGENMRILKWILDRVHGRVDADETAVGYVPKSEDLDLAGLDIPVERIREALHIDLREWRSEVRSQGEFLAGLGPSVPAPLHSYHQLLRDRIEMNLWRSEVTK